jgi:hypothetical protein
MATQTINAVSIECVVFDSDPRGTEVAILGTQVARLWVKPAPGSPVCQRSLSQQKACIATARLDVRGNGRTVPPSE